MTDPIAQIIVAIITVVIPTLTTAITTNSIKRQGKKNSARESILQLILEDKVSVEEGRSPENYRSVLYEYDSYLQAGGNSYIKEKVREYKEWYKQVEVNKEDNANRN